MGVESTLKRVRQVTFFWEAPDRITWGKLATEDRRIEEVELDTAKGCGESPLNDIYQAWQLDSSNMTRDKDHGYMQVITERSAAPVQLWNENAPKWTKTEISKIARLNLQQAKTITTRKNNRDMALYICMAIAILIVIATLLVLATHNIDWGATMKSLPLIGSWFGGK